MNKRLLAGLAAAGIIGGGVYGFAATLDPASDTVGAGSDTVESCDSAVDVDYTVAWGGTAYEIKDVVVSGIDTTKCLGDDISVTLMDGSTAKTATAGVVDAASETFDVSGLDVSARNLGNVHVVIAS
jgi:hypothetical protein